MRKFPSLQNSSPLSFLVLLLFALSCANLKDRQNLNLASTPVNSTSPSANSNSSANQNASASTAQNFTPEIVCLLPKQIAPNTPYANLGGGSWGRWSDSGGELDYGCNGGKDSVYIISSDNGDITAEYGAIGASQTVHYVSVEYMAMQYTGLTPDEKKLRQQYIDFCDKLSVKFYGVKLPEKFRKRLLDESTYSPSGTANEYAEKVGIGYVNLSSNKNKNVMVMLDVHFFSSEAEYKKYKDS
jgi:hypothetical protein